MNKKEKLEIFKERIDIDNECIESNQKKIVILKRNIYGLMFIMFLILFSPFMYIKLFSIIPLIISGYLLWKIKKYVEELKLAYMFRKMNTEIVEKLIKELYG